MKPPRKRRWRTRAVLAGLVLTVVALGGGYYVWSRSDKDLYPAALKDFEQSDEARKQEDLAGARRHLESAEARLGRCLEKEPTNGAALTLRYKVLAALANLVSRDEQQQGQTGDNLPSLDLARRAGESLAKALADPKNAEAQGIALSNCFARDDMRLGQPFAERVVDDADQTGIPNYAGYQTGARFVLAWNMMQGSSPRADEALFHLQQSKKLESPPRWRAVALEVQALKVKAEREKHSSGSRLHPVASEKGGDSARALQAALVEGVERFRREMDQLPQLLNDSPTNRRGVLDFIEVAIDQAPEAREVLERAGLALGLYERCLGLDKARPDLLTEVSIRVALLPGLLAKLPANRTPKTEELAGVNRQIQELALKAIETNPQAAPALCLELARMARREGNLQTTAQFARKGLEAGLARRLGADDPTVLALHAEVAWVLVCQGTASEERDKHLEVLRKNFRALNDGKGQLIEGYLALFDGRLDTALRRLETAQKDPAAAATLFPALGLAYGYMATGSYDRAQVFLEKLQEPLKDFQQLREAERAVVKQLWPDRPAFLLDLFRCYLKQNQLEKASQVFKDLVPYKAEQLTAGVDLVNAFVTLGWESWSAGKTKMAEESFGAARRELDVVRPQAPGDARLVWAEVNLVLHRAGLDNQSQEEVLRKAEAVVRSAWQGTVPESGVPLVRWLIYRKKLADAEEVLLRLERGQPGPQVQLLRAQVGVARSLSPEEAEEIDRAAEALDVKEAWVDDPSLIGPGAALSGYERIGLGHYLNGLKAQAHGDYRQAAGAYERALPYARFNAAARLGLLGSLTSFASKSPKEAGDLAVELIGRQRDEPVLRLAVANAAVRLDSLDVMERELKNLEDMLSKLHQDPALGPYFLARGWMLAGREDRARRELDRGLKANPAHVASLELAARLALADEDWNALLRISQALFEPQPGRVQPRAWYVTALDNIGKTADAKRHGQELVLRASDQSAAFAALVGVLERNREYSAALSTVARWRERLPRDENAVRAQARLLALANRDTKAFVDAEMKNAGPGYEFAITWALAQGFADAKAYHQAIHWAQKALTLVARRPEAERGRDEVAIELLLGDAHSRLGENDKALEVYQTLYKKFPGNMAAGSSLAWLLNQRPGQSEAAFALLETLRRGRFSQKPITGDRLSLDFLNVVGTIYRDARHYKEMVPIFEAALDRYKDEPQVHLHLGRAYAGRGRTAEANQQLETAVKLAEKRARAAANNDSRAGWLALATEARQDMNMPK